MLKPVDIKTLNLNPFSAIGDQWMLITAGTKENCNTMTASWGGLGVLWGKNAATIYIRPQRYTKQFVEESEYFTLAFFTEDWRSQLNLCGTKSGRDVDKVKECGFTVETAHCGAPYFAQAELVLVCRKLYADELKPERFLDQECDTRCYPQRDYHTMYIGEVIEAYQQ